MKDYITTVEVNPFGIDCQRCDNRESLERMTLTEKCVVLCSECILDDRLKQVILHSDSMFSVN